MQHPKSTIDEHGGEELLAPAHVWQGELLPGTIESSAPDALPCAVGKRDLSSSNEVIRKGGWHVDFGSPLAWHSENRNGRRNSRKRGQHYISRM